GRRQRHRRCLFPYTTLLRSRTARGAPGRVTHNYSELCSAIGAGGGGGGVSGRGRAADGNAIFLPLVSQGSGAGSGHGKSSCLARGDSLACRLHGDRRCHGSGIHGEHGRTARGAPGRVTHNHSELCSAIGAGGGGGGVSGSLRDALPISIFLPLVSQGSGAGSGHGKSSCLARGDTLTRGLSADRRRCRAGVVAARNNSRTSRIHNGK